MSKTERKMPEAARPGSLLRGFNPSCVFLCQKEAVSICMKKIHGNFSSHPQRKTWSDGKSRKAEDENENQRLNLKKRGTADSNDRRKSSQTAIAPKPPAGTI